MSWENPPNADTVDRSGARFAVMTERMRIAASYFQGLIDDTPASQAVRDIAAMWHPRVTRVEPWFGLSFPEHNVQMVLTPQRPAPPAVE